MTADRRRLRARLQPLARSQGSSSTGGGLVPAPLQRLADDIARSQQRRARRAALAPRPEFPADLPISARRDDIAAALNAHQVVIVCGETGSGKSTQLPKICLSLGRGSGGLIGHTQPRRIAARAVAARVAEELGTRPGEVVGSKVRFGDSTGPQTQIKVMTDGILLAEVQSDPLLEQYDTLIIDEAHERSLNIDFLLGYLKRLLPRRPDLKLIITSATIDPERFSKHFDNAPIVMVSGRTFPVEVRYREVSAANEDELEDSVEHAIVSAVAELAQENDGDILVFLASEREIRETIELLEEAGWGRHAELLPLLARLSVAEQMKVFNPGAKRRIVLATNVAETSITVPGVRSVIDCGFARMSRYTPRTKVQRLPIEPISRASAAQRAGRCGRVGPGICIRLYSELDLNARPEFTTPEILRTDLTSVVLRMKALRLGDPATFPFVEPPEERVIADAYESLRHLQAVDEAGELTPTGVMMARLPVEPGIARIVLAAREDELRAASVRHAAAGAGPHLGAPGHAVRETRAMIGALDEILIIVAAMSVMDPRERPLAEQQKADVLHARFKDELSDFVSFLKLWWYFKDQAARLSSSRLRKLCRSEFLSFVRLREWEDVYRQLIEMVAELPGGSVGLAGNAPGPGRRPDARRAAGTPQEDERQRHARRDQLLPRESQRRELHGAKGAPPVTPLYESIHRALLAGLITSVGKRADTFEYAGARGVRFSIFPGSGLFKQNPEWVVAGELVRTTKLYARPVARVKAEWIEQAGAHLLKRAYSEPHYEERTARVMASERVTLMGLTLVESRRVHYGPIDPVLSREIFIHHALVEGELPSTGMFMVHNARLVQEARTLQHKLRRVDILADPLRRFAFFEARVPANVNEGATFEKWRMFAERTTPRLLYLTVGDVMALPEGVDLARDFPDEIDLGPVTVPLRYHFEPGTDADGVTAVLDPDSLSRFDARAAQWLAPGMLADKFDALLRSLPKRIRIAFSPTMPVALELARRPWDVRTPLLEALSTELGIRARIDVFPADFTLSEVPPHLFMNFLAVDLDGKGMLQSRDAGTLRLHVNQRLARALRSVPTPWNRDAIEAWDFADIPESVEVILEQAVLTPRVRAFPALVAGGDGRAGLRLFPSAPEAARAHRRGQVRLFNLAIQPELKKYLNVIKGFKQLTLLHSPLGSEQALRSGIAERACELTFVRDGALVRTRSEFTRRLVPAEPWIDDQIKVTAELFAEVLTERQRVALTLNALGSSPALGPSRADALEQLGALIYEDFLVAVPLRWFKRYPVYLRALDRRLQRLRTSGAAGAAKDARLAEEARRRWDDWVELRAEMSPDDPRWEELIDYRWMIEELRVATFAQDLAAPTPMSMTRMDAAWTHLTRA
ncbi:ATP-dependent RNA helicase HrpA [soil metagenome]